MRGSAPRPRGRRRWPAPPATPAPGRSPSRWPVDVADPVRWPRRPRVGRRPGGDRPRGAAGRRRRRRRPRGRHRLLRPVRAGRAAGGQQVLRQARHGRGRRAHRTLLAGRRAGRAGDGARRGGGAGGRRSVRGQGRRAGRRARACWSPPTGPRRWPTAGRCSTPGHAVLVEEYLDGPEVSLFAVTDGTTVVPLLPAQDAKRRDDGDGGPNTGGMGAYAPLPWAPAGLVDEVLATVLQPTVDEMARRGEPFARAAVRRPGAHLARACGWWSSTPASAIRRPRWCCRCWRRRWPGCCIGRGHRHAGRATRRCAGASGPP